MPIETWLAFVAACTVLLVIPGPTILAVIGYSVTHGRAARAPLVLAVALGDSSALLTSTFVVLATLNASFHAMFAATARRYLESPKAQRRFNFVGGSLLSHAGLWALFARRPTP